MKLNDISNVRELRRKFWHLRNDAKIALKSLFQPALQDQRIVNELHSAHYHLGSFKESARRPRVAIISDEFTYLAFSGEFNLLGLTYENWKEELLNFQPDFLFVESAWNGNNGSWKHQIASSAGSISPTLNKLICTCKSLDIPTVFWNKEDPPHYEDFLETARLFDHVFTSDATLIPKYKESLGHENVQCLAFAAQSSIHNPTRESHLDERDQGISFAGTYFAEKYPARRNQMHMLLSAAAKAASSCGIPFTIYSRFEDNLPKYRFPERFQAWVKPAIPYSQIIDTYKKSLICLNVNSVNESSSMCSRRIFEVFGSGALAVTTYTPALKEFFPEIKLPIASNFEDSYNTLRCYVRNEQLRERSIHQVQRIIWTKHTYGHRASQILAALNLPSRTLLNERFVSVISSTNRPQQVDHLLDQFERQTYSRKELVLVCHGFSPDLVEDKVAKRALKKVKILSCNSSSSLGDCLNLAVENSSGEIISKFDDDDYYLENYLLDMVNALFYSRSDIVGKRSLYLYVDDLNVTAVKEPNHEFTFTDFIAGPTITGWSQVFHSIPFASVSHGEDTQFLKSVKQAGYRIFASDRFNFVQFRNDTSKHTWQVGSEELLANSSVVVPFFSEELARA